MDLAENGLLGLLRPEEGEFADDEDPGVQPSEIHFVRKHGALSMDIGEFCTIGLKHLLQTVALGESACGMEKGSTWTWVPATAWPACEAPTGL